MGMRLRSLRERCANYPACRCDAEVELIDGSNRPRGRYCRPCGRLAKQNLAKAERAAAKALPHQVDLEELLTHLDRAATA